VTGDQTVSMQGADQSVSGVCTDNAHNGSGIAFGGIDIDYTPPTLTASDLSVEATDPSGATVGSYPVSATDNLDPSAVVSCTPTAPHRFPIGDTPVSCTATDQAGNVSVPVTFTVHVLGAPDQLTILSKELRALTLPNGLATDLGNKLDNATNALAAGRVTEAVRQLAVFSSRIGQELQSKQPAISTSDGQTLIADAGQIEKVLGMTPAFVATTVVHGDFNGDGRTDIAAFDAATGVWIVGLSKGSKFSFSTWATWQSSVTWTDIRVGDFNGDGKADISGRVLSTGQWWVSLSNGSSFSTNLWATWSSAVTWVDVQVGDFNGDGSSDMAGLDSSGGNWWVAQSTGSVFTNALWSSP
jgi:hypothetical protein